jgi:hypothetical protein
VAQEPFWLKCSLTWTRLVSSDTSLIEAMAAMRIILLASALTSGRAATAIHVVEMYSASDCAPANLVNEMMKLGGCSFQGTEWMEVTCNATHYQKMEYSGDAQCAGTPDVDGTTTIEYSSACTQLNGGSWAKVKCNAAVENPIEAAYVSYTDSTCATMKHNGVVQKVALKGGCAVEGESGGGPWSLTSTKTVYTPGVALSMTKYPTADCSGTPTESTTFACGVCSNEFILNCPSGGGSASSGRRSTPWVVATFGAAALATVAAQHATA